MLRKNHPANRERIVSIQQTGPSDLDFLMELWNDGRVMRWVGYPAGLNYDRDKMEKWYAWISTENNCRHYIVFLDGAACGEVFYRVDAQHRRAGLDIKLRPEYQGKGIAAKALTMLINCCFEQAQAVDEVWTEPSHQNLSAQNLYRKCGLRPESRPEDLTEEADSYWSLARDRWEKMVNGSSLRDTA